MNGTETTSTLEGNQWSLEIPDETKMHQQHLALQSFCASDYTFSTYIKEVIDLIMIRRFQPHSGRY